jgi:enoyl-CoA hydratase/carnithine racemase
MIRGYCIGGGVGLALCCDMRICSEGSKFGVPAAKLGLGYRFDGLKKLVDLVGPSFAKEIFFTARQFTAAEAQMMGLVNRVLPDADLEKYVKDYADTIAVNAPLTVDSVKFIVAQAVADESKRDLKKSDDLVQACFASNDYTEGRKAFMEKRKPQFTGS